jgi:hypothetical protein
MLLVRTGVLVAIAIAVTCDATKPVCFLHWHAYIKALFVSIGLHPESFQLIKVYIN